MNSILYHGLHKNIKQHNHVTLKTVVMTAEIQLCITGINNYLKYIKHLF